MPYSIEKRNQFLNLTFPGQTTITVSQPSKVYLGLCNNDPVTDGGTFAELTCDTYARVLLSRKGQDLPDLLSDIADGKIYNVKQITFNRATEAWTQVKGIGIFESEEGGSPTFYATLKTPVDVALNQIFTFDPNTFVVQFADTDVEIEAEGSAI